MGKWEQYLKMHIKWPVLQRVLNPIELILLTELTLLKLRRNIYDKGIQVAVGLRRPRLCSQVTQTPYTETKDSGTQCVFGWGSLRRKKDSRQWTYDDLPVFNQMLDKEVLIKLLMLEGFIRKSQLCPQCNNEMKVVICNDWADGLKWECRVLSSTKRYRTELSVRTGSWFAQSSMTLEEILKFTYWCCQDLEQSQITGELWQARGTGVD